ncbi:MAG: biotin transporter BioY [Clostridiales bacterium]|nr:biotin transporter BioY [Clostridiales bacterium]
MKKMNSKTQDIVYISICTALLAICSQICIPGAVPFTLQTFAAAFIGAFLGAKKGVIATVIYILLGIVGIPVFAGFRAGIPTLLGGTGGYIIGLIPFAAITGLFCRRFGRKIQVMLPSMILGLAVCYLLGTVWFVHLYAEKGLWYAVSTCVLPFIIPDLIKLFLASLLVKKLENIDIAPSL